MHPTFTSLIFFLLLTLAVGAQDNWQRPTSPRLWEFPRDHGSHPDFQTEWWYFTGNLKSEDNKHYGYQLTFFRQGIQKNPSQANTRWTLRDYYFSHFTITDVANQTFHTAERQTRGTLDHTHYAEDRMNINLKDWSITQNADEPETFTLQASDGKAGISLRLTLTAVKPKVFHGRNGLSQKTSGVGNASYYYSFPRLATRGLLKIGEDEIVVTGSSWFDHEFMSNWLDEDLLGWDWFSLQLNNGEELMLYHLRRKSGIDPLSKGSHIDKDGHKTHLNLDDYQIEILDSWKSPDNGTNYPAKWRITFGDYELTVTPQVEHQELTVHIPTESSYWEGTCKIEGTYRGQPVSGYGYAELTGYFKPVSF
ncbi:MAG: lipocalin-like domain-containing protein [Verrucomicrobiota bacterium]